MRVTVCEISDENFLRDWHELTQHVRDERSELVVLPEMPAYPWFASSKFDEEVWMRAVKSHDDPIYSISQQR
ncbi:MAG: hypothetical protein DRP01_11155 [Archaeoglobales archaeon]|nr:MAG: hypothetical protein DRP01_11155 [Archaeoglobales archaeon]